MSPDQKIDCAKAAIITLAGQEYFVPFLALRQARIVVPGLLKLMPRLNAIQTRLAEGEMFGVALLERDDVETMIDVVHAGLGRAYPNLSRDDVLDLEAGFGELIAALATIARQTGLFTAAESAAPGE